MSIGAMPIHGSPTALAQDAEEMLPTCRITSGPWKGGTPQVNQWLLAQAHAVTDLQTLAQLTP